MEPAGDKIYEMKYFHRLTQEQVEEAIKLTTAALQKTCSRPYLCGYFGALDKNFGCPFLFREKERQNINNRCRTCTCRKEKNEFE